jgi:hypothetical protein
MLPNVVQTTLISDAAVFAMMARVNMVIVGARAVLANGGVMGAVRTPTVIHFATNSAFTGPRLVSFFLNPRLRILVASEQSDDSSRMTPVVIDLILPLEGPDDDDENRLVWPSWVLGVLSGVRDVETYNCGRPSQRSLRGCLNSPSWISCETKVRL